MEANKDKIEDKSCNTQQEEEQRRDQVDHEAASISGCIVPNVFSWHFTPLNFSDLWALVCNSLLKCCCIHGHGGNSRCAKNR